LVSDDIARAAEAVQAEALELPGPREIRDLAAQAVAHGGGAGMSPEEVRELAAKAVKQADQLAHLLRQLSQMVGPDRPEAPHEQR
jgi:hypothetical protein